MFKRIFDFFFKKNPILTVEELVFLKNTPMQLSRWMEFNIEWVHIQDKWSSSKEVLRTRKTNCVGYAVLAHDALKLLGYDPHILKLTPKDYGNSHVICAYKDNVWRYFSNGSIYNCVKAKNFNDIGQIEMPDCVVREVDAEGYYI